MPNGSDVYAHSIWAFREALDMLVTVRRLADADHAASVMSPTGAEAVADLITEAL